MESEPIAGATSVRTHRAWLFLGPAFVAAVAYVDPGNFATNIQAGAEVGYRLVWVVVAANVAAMVIQTQSAKLGLVTGRNLPEHIRDRAPRRLVLAAWLGAEVVAMATDLAELLGAGLGLKLLTGLALFPATVVAAAGTVLLLGLQRRGMPFFEAVIAALIGVIAVSYVAETALGKPDFGALGRSFAPPRLGGQESVLLATGILGATVMPHVIYLHSALMQDRGRVDAPRLRRMLRAQRADVAIALSLAGVINVLMVMLAAATFHAQGLVHVSGIEEAHRTLTPILGSASSAVFAISLLASGLSASAVGTFAGQVIMRGFLHRAIPLSVRRLATMLPALVIAGAGANATRALVLSQVVLSFGIPQALVPLAWLTGREDVMGEFRNPLRVALPLWGLVLLIAALNAFLLLRVFGL
ncbi:MAG TPA: Nramp family divalent metal transporter [Gaiellaceae bacterium]|nr:Nramp family divalent metal transporter [Gaiellaceae bacterium]